MKNKNTILIIAVVIVLIAGIYFYSQGSFGNILQPDRGSNGYWNAEAQECWTTPNALNGGKQEGNLVSCCFDQAGYQVDCLNADKRLSGNQLVFAVYFPTGGASTPGIFLVAHTITISNTGSIPLESVWVDTATWTSSPVNTVGNSNLAAAYSRIIGSSSSYAGAIAVGGAAKSFPTNFINLQDLDVLGTVGTVYTLNLNAKATAYGGTLTSAIPLVKTMKVTKESIGFSVDIVWQ